MPTCAPRRQSAASTPTPRRGGYPCRLVIVWAGDGAVAQMDRAVGVLVGVSRELPVGRSAVLAGRARAWREPRPARVVLERHGDHLPVAAHLPGLLRGARVLHAPHPAGAAAPPGAAAGRGFLSSGGAARRPAIQVARALAAARAEVGGLAGAERGAVQPGAGDVPVHRLHSGLADSIDADAGDARLADLPFHELDH